MKELHEAVEKARQEGYEQGFDHGVSYGIEMSAKAIEAYRFPFGTDTVSSFAMTIRKLLLKK